MRFGGYMLIVVCVCLVAGLMVIGCGKKRAPSPSEVRKDKKVREAVKDEAAKKDERAGGAKNGKQDGK